jgi:hypothetical protein
MCLFQTAETPVDTVWETLGFAIWQFLSEFVGGEPELANDPAFHFRVCVLLVVAEPKDEGPYNVEARYRHRYLHPINVSILKDDVAS